MVQTDRGPPVSNYKEEPVDDPVSIWSIDSFLSSLSTAVVLERFPRFPLSSTLFSWFHSNIKRAFLILLEFSVTLFFFFGIARSTRPGALSCTLGDGQPAARYKIPTTRRQYPPIRLGQETMDSADGKQNPPKALLIWLG